MRRRRLRLTVVSTFNAQVSDDDILSAGGALRTTRSYVRREGRITEAQRRALYELLPGREWPADALSVADVTGRHAPLSLEIGAGDGENIMALAARFPEEDFIACEVHGPGVGHLLLGAEHLGLRNLWIARQDAHDLLAKLPAQALHCTYLFFPDPWPKKRHLKRRIFQAPLLDALTRAMSAHGRLLVATDVADYAQWMLDQAAAAPQWRNLAGAGKLSPRLKRRVLTKFERRALRDGRSIHDFAFAPV